MDELAAPRRSTILPSLLSASTSSEAGSDISLADYVVSMSVDLPQSILYASVSKDLQDMVDGIKEFYRNAEQDAEQDVPALFHEFAGADDEWKEEILVSFHLLSLFSTKN
jgi:Spc7 kinetochore protein